MFTHTLEENEINTVWKATQETLKTQLTPAVFNTWIVSNPLTKVEVDQQNQALATITCPTAFHATNLKKNLYTQIKETLEAQLNKKVEIEFIVGTPFTPNASSSVDNLSQTAHLLPSQPVKTQQLHGFSSGNSTSPTVDELFSAHTLQASFQDRSKTAAKRIGLRLDYTFKTFAVSTTNEMAHAAATAVSNNPGAAYNPLFLYGGVGVGKTHLMQAIANNILKQNPETNVIYCTGEEFTNEIVNAIQKKRAFDFKQKYRNTQVLLIDDVQFLAGKNAVQEEFFHTFNALTKQASQIILTSDRPPHEINLLESRLRSRFEAGLMIDIQQPSFELRTAILLIKAQANHLDLPMNLAQLISSKVDGARRIEGIIKLLRSEVELKQRTITEELIQSLLKTEAPTISPNLRVKPQDIIKTVADHYRIKQSALKGKRRIKDIVGARHTAMYLLRKELNMPLEEIGKWFSGRDHTSVLHAINKIESEIKEESLTQQDISALRMSLTAISKI
ncbi:MAG: chromosomal replication initiator protein DnaA [Candidatus Pacebacteria bacterium CG10_big_fil_rev_8_21_14_0_10_36_11]|nr:chromosomal replication initiator protein DnaA [Candidatus Pacearchaeota archaeon]OIP73889.1 MAG: chromosomal replication initiator protein DnaA [Candidatus Pacebacteria bacterium CG2_30_36_39]PIR64547.1 MAG: chromosomal replication initiator protein DnaA [Candidatus Pacebacteria bacterium CG10_big_fil_rev_8_21_14_0_10_36_11]PJC43253.1 MAG: chromosomal replication initiator protein DnaA [Candidatus Pacebacteria bacterium CG_4_9_14_0_2_um_filter_36_8]